MKIKNFYSNWLPNPKLFANKFFLSQSSARAKRLEAWKFFLSQLGSARAELLFGLARLFRKLCYCIHSNKVKKKQGHCETKRPQSVRARNIDCNAKSIKWRKIEGGSSKKRKPISNNNGKENLDSMVIPA
jgi:hypothetical protein